MKIIYVTCELTNDYVSDLRSNEHYSSVSEKKGLKKFGLVRELTYDPCDTSVVLHQLS